nr:MAG TPA: hypothetical protein [Caudoviricetes sp.]
MRKKKLKVLRFLEITIQHLMEPVLEIIFISKILHKRIFKVMIICCSRKWNYKQKKTDLRQNLRSLILEHELGNLLKKY